MISATSPSFSSTSRSSTSSSPSTSFLPSASALPSSLASSGNGPTYTTTVTVYQCPPSGAIAPSVTPVRRADSKDNGIPGPSACPRSQSSSSSPVAVHPRDFSLSLRGLPSTPEEAKIKGTDIMARILAATADTSPDSTTDKFLASYVNIDRPHFTIDELLSSDIPRSIASEIAADSQDVRVPVFPRRHGQLGSLPNERPYPGGSVGCHRHGDVQRIQGWC
ncbi:hypothetical protein C8J57DRAFT_1367294 [Mycena rebaudengoi]|nr:hypothetical protein C8J57DRAFT_1367294 [Mycena rebaudengoi]